MSINLCKYSDIFGKVGKGVHSIRFLGIAIVDVILTIIGSYIISYIFNINFIYVLVSLFILGIFLHRIFCVRTTVDKILFKNL
tara:strand:+ start:3117 stop:3365 length:249 start_codon:yes stop_codon:yes gene_type:complete